MTLEIESNIYNKALDIISRREHSEKELENKLLKNLSPLTKSIRLLKG